MAIKGGENAICGMRHTERPSGHRPRSLMRTTCRVRRAPALELAPTIFFLDTTRGTTISRGDVVDGATTRRYLCGSLAQVACGDGYGVTTGRDKPLKPGGTGHHALLNPCQSHFPENCKTGAFAKFWRLRSARCWAGDAARREDVLMRTCFDMHA